MSIFRYPIEETVGGYFFIEISIPVNQERYKEFFWKCFTKIGHAKELNMLPTIYLNFGFSPYVEFVLWNSGSSPLVIMLTIGGDR